MRNHKVYLIGAGPGRADMITVRGLKILQQADVIIHDYLVDKAALEGLKPGAEIISSERYGKKACHGRSGQAQKKINDLMVKMAKAGRHVARLKNGDTSIFSRISEEIEALEKNKIEFEIVPGVTAASAASSFTGVPLTDRRYSSNVVFVTGHENPDKGIKIDWRRIAGMDTIALYMSSGDISDIAWKLIRSGRPETTAVLAVSNAGAVNQKTAIAALGSIADTVQKNAIKAPAIFIIGKTAGLEKRYNWLRKNRRILFTGLSGERFFLKGAYFHLPLIRIEPLEDYSGFDRYLKNIKMFDWIVFSSRFGVEYFFKRLKELGLDARILNNIKIAAIGNCTSERLLDFTISADLVPKKESSKGLIDEFRELDIKAKKIFLPRSDISDKGLEKEFEKLGAKVTSSFAYRNVMAEGLPDLDLNFFNEIMFTSPSGVRNFIKRYGKPPKKIKISCIGDVTKKEAEKAAIQLS